jgi:Zn-dependent protease with chaperone function
MKRRPFGRDLGLSIRMAIALIPIVLWYLLAAALFVGLAVFVVLDPSWKNVLSVGFFAIVGPISLREHLRHWKSVALRAARADDLARGEKAELQNLVARVSAQADLAAPRVAIAPSRAANAFSVGLTERRAVVAFTSELLRRELPAAESEAVVAHKKIAGETPRGDLRGGLAVQALCIVPARTRGWRRFELFSDHPPLEKRLERLGELSRQLGKAG